MGDRNFNQRNQSNQDWERDKNRLNQENDWSQNREGGQSYGNANHGSEHRDQQFGNYGDVGYSGDSAHGMGSDYGSNYNRDHKENRNTDAGFNQSNFGRQNRSQYGNAGSQYGNNDWSNQSHHGGQHRGRDDWNRRQSGQTGSNNWNSEYGRQDWGRGNVNTGYQGNQQDYERRDYGNYGNTSDQHNRNWDRNRYGGDTRNGGNANQGGVDNNWWDRTKDKVSSWFSDNDNGDRRNRDYSGGHRGKGPSDYRRSQDRIREDICDRLTDDDRVDASNVRVEIQDDAVILSGTVNSREEKRRAEDLVESISGVRNVENRLRVGHSNDLRSHDYTGNTDRLGGIGTESGTTNEIIRNTGNDTNKEKKA